MLTRGLIAEVRDNLDDPNEKRYPDDEIIRHGDRQLRSMFRAMCVANKDYSNFTYCAKSTDGRIIFKDSYEFRLPSWIEAIANVCYRTETAATQTSFSPYRWTADSIRIGVEIPRESIFPNPRWTWEGNNTLKVWNTTQPPELVIQCVKRPSKLFAGKIVTLHSVAGSLYLPPAALGEVEIEEGAYINADFQVTSTATANATQYGNVRRCIYSNAATLVAGTRQHELIFDQDYAAILAQNDEIQTIVPIPDEHMRYLVLRVANACMQKRNAQIGQAAISAEMAFEGNRFTQTIQPRDKSGPMRWRTRNSIFTPYLDRERYVGNGWW